MPHCAGFSQNPSLLCCVTSHGSVGPAVEPALAFWSVSARATVGLAVTVLVTMLGLSACGRPAGSDAAEDLHRAEIPETIEVTSPAFADGELIPDRYTCDGEELPPPLHWEGVPVDTAEVAVVVDGSRDANLGERLWESYRDVHWIVVGLDPHTGDLVEAEIPPRARQARNTSGAAGYMAPCTSRPGPDPWEYQFAVYALDEPLRISEGAETDAVLDAIRQTAIARGTLTGELEVEPGPVLPDH